MFFRENIIKEYVYKFTYKVFICLLFGFNILNISIRISTHTFSSTFYLLFPLLIIQLKCLQFMKIAQLIKIFCVIIIVKTFSFKTTQILWKKQHQPLRPLTLPLSFFSFRKMFVILPSSLVNYLSAGNFMPIIKYYRHSRAVIIITVFNSITSNEARYNKSFMKQTS